jgi:plastocyanin
MPLLFQGVTRESGQGRRVVSIANFKFGPETLAAAPNTPITWHNADGSPHQVTITGAKPQRSEVILKGQTAQLIIAEPGTYDYICGLHPAMKGKIEIK